MSKEYRNPPIIEALCEFRFSQSTPWDPTVPGLLYKELSGEFPIKESKVIQEVRVSRIPSGGIQQNLATSERTMFLNPERNMIIQVGDRLVAVNCLEPYPTWKVFKKLIDRAFSALAATGGTVNEVQRIDLRYINRIRIPAAVFEMEDYFEFRPFLGKGLPQDFSSFFVGSVLECPEKDDACKIELTSRIPRLENTSEFLLDLTYFRRSDCPVPTTGVSEWVENAHTNIEKVFEGSLTDNLRKLFSEGSSDA